MQAKAERKDPERAGSLLVSGFDKWDIKYSESLSATYSQGKSFASEQEHS